MKTQSKGHAGKQSAANIDAQYANVGRVAVNQHRASEQQESQHKELLIPSDIDARYRHVGRIDRMEVEERDVGELYGKRFNDVHLVPPTPKPSQEEIIKATLREAAKRAASKFVKDFKD